MIIFNSDDNGSLLTTIFQRMSGDTSVSKQAFAKVFRDAWERAYNPTSISTSFRLAGLCPWNPNAPDYSKCKSGNMFRASQVRNVLKLNIYIKVKSMT